MGAERLLMRQIREILRLKHEQGLHHRAIARACGVGVGTVSEYVQRVQHAGLVWPLPPELDEAALESRLFKAPALARERVAPDCSSIHQELKRVGVTLHLLWEEYRQVHAAQGYGYSQFCEHYRRWAGRLKPSMRQQHCAGEKTFIDYSGKQPHLIDRKTGEERPLELFVAALGASCYTYAEASETQKLHDWISAHTRMAEYFGGVTELWVPDQLKSGVTRPCRYEPGVNRSYQELAAHYGAVVVPARPGKARDKAKVESMVLVAQRWILARLRNRQFFELGELNAAIGELLGEQLEARYTASVVEIYYKGRRLDSHTRRYDHQPSTKAEHMPSSHRAHAEWTPSRLIHWAEKSGAATGRLVAGILRSRPHPEQGYRACLGLMRLGRHYGAERLEAACTRAEQLRSYSYRTVKNILASAQDRLPFEGEPAALAPTPSHENIRGAHYYAAEEENEC